MKKGQHSCHLPKWKTNKYQPEKPPINTAEHSGMSWNFRGLFYLQIHCRYILPTKFMVANLCFVMQTFIQAICKCQRDLSNCYPWHLQPMILLMETAGIIWGWQPQIFRDLFWKMYIAGPKKITRVCKLWQQECHIIGILGKFYM